MKSVRVAIVSGLVLVAGAASAATKGPAYIDLTGCCGSIHKAGHEKAYFRSLQVPPSERGKFMAENSCGMAQQRPARDLTDPKR